MRVSTAFVLLILVAVLVVATPPARAQDLFLQADYATYRSPTDSLTYVEIYCSVYRYQLGFIADDTVGSRFAGVVLSAKTLAMSGQPVDSSSTYFVTRVADSSEINLPGVRIFDYLPLLLRPGEYRVLLQAYDRVSQKQGQAVLTISVPYFCRDCLALSDLELAYNIEAAAGNTSDDRLVKQDRRVVPNTTGSYVMADDSVMYVYAELYGLDTTGSTGTYTVSCAIKDSVGQVLHNYGDLEYDKPGESAVLSKQLDIRYLPPGVYNLVLSAIDTDSQKRTVSSKKFSISSGTVLASSSAAVDTARALTDEDVQTMVNIAYYHLSEAEKIQIGKLTPEGKRNFLQQFWRERDEDPSTPENEFYNEAVRRYFYAIDHFSTSAESQDGWRTDRGRVYIMYGPWDEREEMYFAQGNFPFELWTYYDVEGGAEFVFVSDDKTAVNDYRLVHSSAPGEIKNYEWEARLESGLPTEDY